MRQNKFHSSNATIALTSLGMRIRRLRKSKKWSLTDLQERTGVHRTTLSRLELGHPGVTIGAMAAVLETLGILSDLELLVIKDESTLHQNEQVPHLDPNF